MIDNAQALKDRITLQNTDVDEDTKARLLNAIPEFGWPLYLWNAMADKETEHSYRFVDAETDRDKVKQVVLYLKDVKEYAEQEIGEWEDLLQWVEEHEESPIKEGWLENEQDYRVAAVGTVVALSPASVHLIKGYSDNWIIIGSEGRHASSQDLSGTARRIVEDDADKKPLKELTIFHDYLYAPVGTLATNFSGGDPVTKAENGIWYFEGDSLGCHPSIPRKVDRWGKPEKIQGEEEYNSAPIGTIVASKLTKLPWYKVRDGWSAAPNGAALDGTTELAIFYSDAREVVQWGNK